MVPLILVLTLDQAEDAPKHPVPLLYSKRPITHPERNYRLFVGGAGTLLDANTTALTIRSGAAYGLDERTEVGLVLFRWTISKAPDTGIEAPTLFARYRLLDGIFALAAEAEVEVPISSFSAFVRLPMLLRLPFSRLDLIPQIGLLDQGRQFTAGLEAELRVELGEHFTLGPTFALTYPDLQERHLWARWGARLGWTFGKSSGALSDIGLNFWSQERALVGEAPRVGLGQTFTGVLTASFFMDDPNQPSPLDTDF